MNKKLTNEVLKPRNSLLNDQFIELYGSKLDFLQQGFIDFDLISNLKKMEDQFRATWHERNPYTSRQHEAVKALEATIAQAILEFAEMVKKKRECVTSLQDMLRADLTEQLRRSHKKGGTFDTNYGEFSYGNDPLTWWLSKDAWQQRTLEDNTVAKFDILMLDAVCTLSDTFDGELNDFVEKLNETVKDIYLLLLKRDNSMNIILKDFAKQDIIFYNVLLDLDRTEAVKSKKEVVNDFYQRLLRNMRKRLDAHVAAGNLEISRARAPVVTHLCAGLRAALDVGKSSGGGGGGGGGGGSVTRVTKAGGDEFGELLDVQAATFDFLFGPDEISKLMVVYFCRFKNKVCTVHEVYDHYDDDGPHFSIFYAFEPDNFQTQFKDNFGTYMHELDDEIDHRSNNCDLIYDSDGIWEAARVCELELMEALSPNLKEDGTLTETEKEMIPKLIKNVVLQNARAVPKSSGGEFVLIQKRNSGFRLDRPWEKVEVDLNLETGRDLYEKVNLFYKSDLLKDEELLIQFHRHGKSMSHDDVGEIYMMKSVKLDQSLKDQGIRGGMYLKVLVLDKALVAHVFLGQGMISTLEKMFLEMADETGLIDSEDQLRGLSCACSLFHSCPNASSHCVVENRNAWMSTKGDICEMKLERVTCTKDKAEEAIRKICKKYKISMKKFPLIKKETLIVPDPIILVSTIDGETYKVPVHLFESDAYNPHKPDTGKDLEYKVKRMMRLKPSAKIEIRWHEYSPLRQEDTLIRKKETLLFQGVQPLTELCATVLFVPP